ncbi:MAG: ParA family protein, partial [Bacteroidetes bacterium]|nr:ParA family protein [Bacteroidota bacterium]
SVAGYLESRLNSPFQMVRDVSPFVCRPHDFNKKIPENLLLICGDNLIELFAEPIRQTSQLEIPFDAWKQVLNWIKDFIVELRQMSGDREAVFTIDCNPSYAIYTQLAIVAADYLIVPFTADDSSRRAFENLIALVFGIADRKILPYAKISFAKRAKKEGVSIPKLHTFINNRVAAYEGKPGKAFMAVSKTIKTSIDDIYKTNRNIFSNHLHVPSKNFFDIPDYHSACVVSSYTGTPLHKMKAGPKLIEGERIQLNKDPLDKYRKALTAFVKCL